jgi:hypothetical protein
MTANPTRICRLAMRNSWRNDKSRLPDSLPHQLEENVMARGEQKSNREKKKPKKEKVKSIAAAPSQKGTAASWQPNLGSDKRK